MIPIRNESLHIDDCLRSVTRQAYPTDLLEIIVVEGDSSDDTPSRLTAWAERDARIRVVGNPERLMVPGLNSGITSSSGAYVGCVSGHSELPRDYVRTCVSLIQRHDAWGVGAGIDRRGVTSLQRAIGRAQSHPFGVGGASYNYGSRSGWAEAIFPGFWPRWVFDRVGLFDQRMLFNEDNEFSHRIRSAGGRLWYEPSLQVGYFPRGSLDGLARQYWGYGAGKAALFAAHPDAVRPRHLAPAGLVAALIGGAVLSVAVPVVRMPTLLLGVAYLVAAVAAAMLARRPGERVTLIAAAFAAMHVAYGAGFWSGVASSVKRMLLGGVKRTRSAP